MKIRSLSLYVRSLTDRKQTDAG